ncbi:hypothetical protein L2E82_25649 [Cichorium intybus]|uniref:Uncharacterized protein n=1 Tax=Cichorium intybus TaxID=13427 RepID=A0ACB9E4D5_CICIN|nr:hypothetical protein L2E82_25649 [Cichorium intybus]
MDNHLKRDGNGKPGIVPTVRKLIFERLDPALIRRGRMDKHIELSNCCFETFKVLAKNYLDIESHELFPSIRWGIKRFRDKEYKNDTAKVEKDD